MYSEILIYFRGFIYIFRTMNIKSVKDFSLENLEFDVSIHYNDYVPEAVYGGFIKSNKEQLEIIS